eukprot:TRINITY_DN1358_c1_g1_i2.p1 TRINITY_DN1358_c1_g1~~TRINITY_DN1358_c1_g1_i2.p1  ORF type:complete len:877 (+),score=157.72 TRINITY_DN1358_c1_g1_i2:293-2923(+)
MATPSADTRPGGFIEHHFAAAQLYSEWLGPGDLFAEVNLGAAVFGREGITSCSDYFAEMVGCTLAELHGRQPEGFALDEVCGINQPSLPKTAAPHRDYPWKTKDGGCIWLRVRSASRRGDHVMCIFDDVTDTKCLEAKLEALAASNKFLETTVENVPVGLAHCVMDETWTINRALENISGYKRDEVDTLDKWIDACYVAKSDEVRQLYAEAKRQGWPKLALEVNRKDGERRWLEFTGQSYDGGTIWLIQDVTERLMSEEKSRCVFDYSLEPMFLVDKGIIVDCNHAAVRTLRAKDRASFLAMRLSPVDFSPEFQPDGQRSAEKFAMLRQESADRHVEWMVRRFDGSEDPTFVIAKADEQDTAVAGGVLKGLKGAEAGERRTEWMHRRLDGTPLPTLELAKDIRVGDRMLTLTVWQDLTEAKKQEEELRRAKEAAEDASIAKSRSLANMSHEIRTPMNGVIGVVELLRSTPLTEEQKSYLEILGSSGASLLRILSDVLDLAKVESQSLQLESIEFGLRDLLSDTLALLRVASQEKGLKLCTEINAEVPDKLVGDPTRLRQVLLNLLSNAIKFTEKGSIRVKVGVDMQKRKRRRVEDVESGDGQRCSRVSGSCMLNFDVIDNGVGIAPETASQLFEAFTQADSSTSRKYGGTGLGLTICKNLVSLMGGEIAVISDIGVGSTFSFSVRLGLPPLFSRKRSLSPTPPTSSARDSPTRSENTDASSSRIEKWKGLSVLIVEDNKVNQIVATRMLKLLGLQKLDVVENGAKAVDACKKVRYDIVLMDCHMPEMDGFEATLQIRALSSQDCSAPDWSQPLIAALTASALSHERERCEQVGMDVFLTKPVQVKDLEIVLRSEAEGLYQTRRQPQAERVPGEALD